MKNRVPEELLTSPVFSIKRLGMKAKEESHGAYADAGIHPYHYAILATLAEGERETQGAIADALDYDRGQLVGLLDEMEEAGLVERRRDTEDRRRQIVVMTPSGRKMLIKARRRRATRRRLSRAADGGAAQAAAEAVARARDRARAELSGHRAGSSTK